MTHEEIERVLADFRNWMVEATDIGPPVEEPKAIDLHTVVSQFTALRHEINLQTKASRSTLEQNGEALAELRSAVQQLQEKPEEDDGQGPLLKAMVDVYDNLALALKQVTRQREAIDKPLDEIVDGSKLPARVAENSNGTAAKPGFWARLFGVEAPSVATMANGAEPGNDRLVRAATLVRSSLDSVLTGYRMSLARIDRALEQHEMEPIAAQGQPFDPEFMEVVDVVADSGRPAGEVLEEVRRGYIRDEVVFRYAQVKVAR